MVNDVDYLVDYIIYIQSGWWLSHPSEKYEFVSWDDYSQYMAKQTCSKTTNQYIDVAIFLFGMMKTLSLND